MPFWKSVNYMCLYWTLTEIGSTPQSHLRVQEHDLGSFGVSPFVSRRSLQLTLDLVCLCWLGGFLLFSVGELIFDLFLTSSNNLTATVESNAATERKKKSPLCESWPKREYP